jgi:heat shock protein HslJ
MKHILVMVIVAGILASCAGGATGIDGGAAPQSGLAAPRANAEVWGSEWKLVEIRTGARSVEYDRDQLASDGFDDLFTLQFATDGLAGKAAPNRYSGPYERGDGQALRIGNVVSTLAAPMEPVKCRESDYFAYLAKVSRWELNQGTLELYSQDADGNEAVLSYLSYSY